MWNRIVIFGGLLLFFINADAVNGHSSSTNKFSNGPDVPAGETLICRYPADFKTVKNQIDLQNQQKGDLRCELKYFSHIQRPCDFRKVTRYKLVTITLTGEYAHDNIRCTYNDKKDILHIEDATKRDEDSIRVKFNVYTVKK